MSNQKRYLFKIVRRGYDPDEVLFCIQKLIQIFEVWLTKSDKLVERWREEAYRMKQQAGEDRKWVEELERQNRRLREENWNLRHGTGYPLTAGGESASPTHGTPDF